MSSSAAISVSQGGTLVAVPVVTGENFQHGTPSRLFNIRLGPKINSYSYSVAPDGQRFLVITPPEEAAVAPITVVLNWEAARRK